jgi:hypothetical protein
MRETAAPSDANPTWRLTRWFVSRLVTKGFFVATFVALFDLSHFSWSNWSAWAVGTAVGELLCFRPWRQWAKTE